MDEITFPVAEIFESVQGEGAHAGRVMTFVRLAGCNVGRPFTAEQRTLGGFAIYQEQCRNWNGVAFACDTNYRRSAVMSIAQIIDAVLKLRPQESVDWSTSWYVSLTGGEPLLHKNIDSLICALLEKDMHVHIETSGTKELHGTWARHKNCWLTVSPKQGYDVKMLVHANAIKVLIDADFNEEHFVARFRTFFSRVWVQAVNPEAGFDEDNMRRCVEIVRRYPEIRISTQVHKLWGVR